MSYAESERTPRDELPILVVGAGLTGSMIALVLAQRGFKLIVVESRGDPREVVPSSGDGVYDKYVE